MERGLIQRRPLIMRWICRKLDDHVTDIVWDRANRAFGERSTGLIEMSTKL